MTADGLFLFEKSRTVKLLWVHFSAVDWARQWDLSETFHFLIISEPSTAAFKAVDLLSLQGQLIVMLWNSSLVEPSHT